ncbi:hypothetical protein INT44_003193 [Umbelopsis vinacea]|uniref:Survival Motor Neuron Gemin2-binding domain-containing protein n=1 Tax=Umbelopsis vinacea TaxID=44442 RepID=A0A8H7UKY0_9FUNG|nr:hypothetical protein INT44_003193 [Umbelopsis vinacea]
MEPYEDQVPEGDLAEEEYYDDEEYDEYEDYDAPQVGDAIMIAGEDNDAWDDTALIEAWDDAVKEYQTYHSTTAADDPPFSKKAAAPKPAKAVAISQQPPPLKAYPVCTSQQKKARTYTVGYTDQESRASTRNDTTPVRTDEADTNASWYQYPNYWPQQPYDSNASSAPPPPPPPPMSHPSTNAPGEDEALSNLMMAWYYSGYYTGYYQAMRKR